MLVREVLEKIRLHNKEKEMLILTRKPGELVKIGDDISVVVISTTNGQVRLGFEAPATTQIHREEIYKRIKKGETKNVG